jgi:hypothetical protein
MQHKIDNLIANWATNNEIDKLKKWLSLQETRLSGHSWNYHTCELIIENAARDAILAGHEEFVQLLLQAGLSPDCWAHISDTNSHQLEQLIYFAAN